MIDIIPEEKSLTEKLYDHWSFMILAIWGALSLLVIPMWAIVRPTNYDTIIVIGMVIVTMITWMYVYIIDESQSSKSYSRGLKRIMDNKNFTTDEKNKRSNMYRRMF